MNGIHYQNKGVNMDRIKDIMDDIRYLEVLGLESNEIFESILRDYADTDNKDILTAFTKCGYTVNL